MEPYTITYRFKSQGKDTLEYSLNLDSETGSLITEPNPSPPVWTDLENNKCSICPLKKTDNPWCPIAVNIADIVEHFKNSSSTEVLEVMVITSDRYYFKHGALQYALYSILGIVMAASGCPVMNFLKPMARFHLPFSSRKETLVRTTAMYLLRQYFKHKFDGTPFDADLTGLDKKYEQLMSINEGMLGRIRTVVSKGDAEGNALVIFHTFSQLFSAGGMESNLDSVKALFGFGDKSSK
jgi:hypothetical protein